MHTPASRQRGVSLIEALVAFGVMAFGMMAVIGMQSTLRSNGDQARQRAEAVRIAQDYIEEWRGFTKLATTADRTAYADIATVASSDIVGTNATYRLTRQVNADAPIAGTVAAQRQTLVVDVSWTDRVGQTQAVRLATSIVGIEPELSASVALAANPDPVLPPRGRHRGIPPAAVPLGVGRSGFVPPGQTGGDSRVVWAFNNATGLVTLCTTTGTTNSDLLTLAGTPTCGTNIALLISGVVRFATSLSPPLPLTAAFVANPAGPDYPNFGLRLVQSLSPSGTQNISCFQEPLVDTQVQFYCAVPITTADPFWAGRLEFGSPLNISNDVNDDDSNEFKVCRYFTSAAYTNVRTPLLSQNFVIIRAGDGSTEFRCPTTGTPRTWEHQPHP